jgi:hypothetical protein
VDNTHALLPAILLHPKPWDSIAMDALDGTNLTQLISESVFYTWRNCKKESFSGGRDEWYGGGKDEDCDEDRGERIEAGPAEILDKEGGDNDSDRAERVGENVKEDSVHVLIVVMGVSVGVTMIIVRVTVVWMIVCVIVVIMIMAVVMTMTIAAALLGLFMWVAMRMGVSVRVPVMNMGMIESHDT